MPGKPNKHRIKAEELVAQGLRDEGLALRALVESNLAITAELARLNNALEQGFAAERSDYGWLLRPWQ